MASESGEKTPSRIPTAFSLQTEDAASAIDDVTHPRQRQMIGFLADENADSAHVLDMLQGRELVLLPQEEPAEALVRSLPDPDSPWEPIVRGVLVDRIRELLAWLSTSSQTQLVRELPGDTWIELIGLLERLGSSEFGAELWQLFNALDQEDLPIGFDETIRFEMTELIVPCQQDSRLQDRWQSLLDGNTDSLLDADLFLAMRGFLHSQVEVDLERFEAAVTSFAQTVTELCESPDQRRHEFMELWCMIKDEYQEWGEVLNLVVSDPVGDREMVAVDEYELLVEVVAHQTVSDVDDPAVLSQLSANGYGAMRTCAASRYRDRIGEVGLCEQFKNYVRSSENASTGLKPGSYRKESAKPQSKKASPRDAIKYLAGCK